MKPKLCRFCNQPMKPKGVKKMPDVYDHARGCPYDRKPKQPWNYPLFKHMADNHNLTLLESEMVEIIAVVKQITQPI